jgi:hypothetical protein
MLNEEKQIRPNCKVEAIQTLRVIWGERLREEAQQNARLKEMKDCARKEKRRMKQSTPNDFEPMLLHKENGAIIRHPPSLPLNY